MQRESIPDQLRVLTVGGTWWGGWEKGNSYLLEDLVSVTQLDQLGWKDPCSARWGEGSGGGRNSSGTPIWASKRPPYWPVGSWSLAPVALHLSLSLFWPSQVYLFFYDSRRKQKAKTWLITSRHPSRWSFLATCSAQVFCSKKNGTVPAEPCRVLFVLTF